MSNANTRKHVSVAANPQVAKVFAKAKINVVSTERIVAPAKGRPAVFRLVLEGTGVHDAQNRVYFKKVRIPALAELGVKAELQRKPYGSPEDAPVVLLISAA